MAFFMGLFAGLFQSSVYETGDVDVIFVYEFIIKTAGLRAAGLLSQCAEDAVCKASEQPLLPRQLL